MANKIQTAVMAACTFWALDLHETLHPPEESVIEQIKHAEKKIFPRNEAFDFDTELKKRNGELFVVMEKVGSLADYDLAAYLVYVHIPKVALLHKVCVMPKYRRRGIARRMLLLQHEKLALRGCAKVQLWVDEERMPARSLYSSIGFKEVGRFESYYGPGRTALRMVLEL